MMPQLQRHYERLREAARQEAGLRRRAAEARCPELAQLAQRRRDLLLAGTPDAAALSQLAAREAELIRELGLPGLFSPATAALLFRYRLRRRYHRKPCACRKQYAQDPCRGERYRIFENYDPAVYHEGRFRSRMASIRAYLERWAGEAPRPTPSTLLLMGSVGLGKSFLLNAMAYRAHQAGASVELLPAYRLMRRVLDSFEEPSILDELLALDLLCIDDLGVEPLMKNVTLEYLFFILNERQAAGRATALASNLDQKQLQSRYSERVFSRLMSPDFTKLIFLQGSDIRLAGKNPGLNA